MAKTYFDVCGRPAIDDTIRRMLCASMGPTNGQHIARLCGTYTTHDVLRMAINTLTTNVCIDAGAIQLGSFEKDRGRGWRRRRLGMGRSAMPSAKADAMTPEIGRRRRAHALEQVHGNAQRS